ncbi:MAG: protoporphyrinogen oxidase, partial [Acidimicrobiales bacterium]
GGSARGAGAAPAPVFLTHRGGLGLVVGALERELAARGVELLTRSPVGGLDRGPGAWLLSTPEGPVEADAVVLAVPAFVAAPLLAPHAPGAAGRLEAIGYASVSLVTLWYPASALARPLRGSGYLVPAGEGRLTTACTFMSSKWPHLARPDQLLFRVSAGRWGDDRHLELSDEELATTAHRELAAAVGVQGPGPRRWRVARWPRSFPQYEVGHLDLVDQVEDDLARLPGLAVAGAAYRGLGIPACIAQGQRAARAVSAGLSRGTISAGG